MEELPVIDESSKILEKILDVNRNSTTSESSIERGTLPTDDKSIEKISKVYDKLWKEFHMARVEKDLKDIFEFKGICNMSERLKAWSKAIAVVDITLFGDLNIEMYYTAEHPFRPPRIIFNPPIDHELVSPTTGAWMADIVGEQWSPSFTIRLLLSTILGMLNL